MELDKVLTTIDHDHDHEKEIRSKIVEKFRKTLTKKAIEKPSKPLVDIYLEETQNHSEASILYPFVQAESTMRKARGKHSSEEIEKSKQDADNSRNFQHFRYFFHNEIEGGVIVVLMNQATMNVMGKIEEIHVDCRIRLDVDEGNGFYYLVTVLGIQKGRDCALAFGIFPSINFNSLMNFFTYLNLKLSSILTPSTILTSPNDLLQYSLKSSWPDASIKIMYFYYAHSILTRISKHLLNTLTKNVFQLSSLKMILAIPLIPSNYVIPGWEALRKWMEEKSVDLNATCDYVYEEWLAVGAERISIFNGLSHSIINYTQVINRDLINSFGDVRKLENFIQRITKIASKSFVKFSKCGESAAKKTQKLEKIVKFATKSWISSPFHLRRPMQFLQQVSHCIDDGMIHFVANYCDEEQHRVVNVKKIEIIHSTEPPPLIYFNQKDALKPPSAEIFEK